MRCHLAIFGLEHDDGVQSFMCVTVRHLRCDSQYLRILEVKCAAGKPSHADDNVGNWKERPEITRADVQNTDGTVDLALSHNSSTQFFRPIHEGFGVFIL